MIRHERFYLEHMRIADIPAVCNLFKSDSTKMLFDNFGSDMDEIQVANIYANKLNSVDNNSILFLVYLKKSCRLIGYTSVTNIDYLNRCAEISIMIDEKYQYVGYGPLVSAEVINYCFEELNMIKVYSKTRVDNPWDPSPVGGQLIRKVPAGNGRYHDYYHREIFKTEWVNVRSKG